MSSDLTPTTADPAIVPVAATLPPSFKDANFPTDPEGRVYHLGVKKGEVANRILSVGSETRAAVIASFLDAPERTFVKRSNRGFVTYTGRRNGVPISIIVTGMGTSMMDFVVRESRAVVDGPMIIARYGTCGTPQPDVPVGSVAVCTEGSIMISNNYDAFEEGEFMYHITKPVRPDAELTDLIKSKLVGVFGESRIVGGLNATADSFYSSQARKDPHFEDRNTELMDILLGRYKDLSTIEMETFLLLHLARASRGTIRAGAATMVLAQRHSNDFLDKATFMKLEREGGRAVLDAVAELPLENAMDGPDCVWNM